MKKKGVRIICFFRTGRPDIELAVMYKSGTTDEKIVADFLAWNDGYSGWWQDQTKEYK